MGKSKKAWLPAVKQAMQDASEQEAKRRFGTKDPLFNYRWEHVSAVVTLAVRLAELTGADREVVEAAAWLHDVRKEAGDKHPKEGAKFARKLLRKTDFPNKKIKLVTQAIEEHMGLWTDEPLTLLESQILWDADKLAKLGLTAVFHWSANDLARGRISTTEEILARLQNPDWLEKTVASMHTKPARRAAQKRLKAYKKLGKKLETELNAADLK